jgi:hypothetical protein
LPPPLSPPSDVVGWAAGVLAAGGALVVGGGGAELAVAGLAVADWAAGEALG